MLSSSYVYLLIIEATAACCMRAAGRPNWQSHTVTCVSEDAVVAVEKAVIPAAANLLTSAASGVWITLLPMQHPLITHHAHNLRVINTVIAMQASGRPDRPAIGACALMEMLLPLVRRPVARQQPCHRHLQLQVCPVLLSGFA